MNRVPAAPALSPLRRLGLYRERRRRGARELSRLKRAQAVLFSPGNSGRTWLRVMLTRVIERSYGLSSPPLINFDNLRKLDHRIPAIAVTHNRWLPYYRRPREGKDCEAYYPHDVLILVRNPLDTCVSQYFQWLHRSKDSNVLLKGWPPRSSCLGLEDFLAHPLTGVERMCQELATWWRESHKFKGVCVLRYEDMLADPQSSLSSATRFFQLPATEDIVREAVEYGSFSNMKRREMAGVTVEADALVAETQSADAHKAREGKVSGYVNHLDPATCAHYTALVGSTVPFALGYDRLPEIRSMDTSVVHE